MSRLLYNWSRLYTKPTKPELSMERAVATLGVPYRFQHPEFRMGVVLDFALPSHRIAIEVDGPDHNQPKKRQADTLRTERLEALGWTVVRCLNEEALRDPWSTLDRMLEPWGLRSSRSRAETVEAGQPSTETHRPESEPPAAPRPTRRRRTRS